MYTASHGVTIFFFFNDTATTEIYTLSLHDAPPISRRLIAGLQGQRHVHVRCQEYWHLGQGGANGGWLHERLRPQASDVGHQGERLVGGQTELVLDKLVPDGLVNSLRVARPRGKQVDDE